MQKKRKLGIIVGRFQVPNLHEGHKHLINEVIKFSDNVVIFLGCPARDAQNINNPLTFSMRNSMIREAYGPISISYIYDRLKDEDWSNDLDRLLEGYKENHEIKLYGSRDSFIETYTGKYETHTIPNICLDSGEKIRENVTLINSSDFRSGVIYTIVKQQK